MKIVLTGATGRIGGLVLLNCLSNPSISSVVVLGRRNLPSEVIEKDTKQKIRNIILTREEFLSYPQRVLNELQGADACIWTLGRPIGNQELNLDMPSAALRAFAAHVAPKIKEERGKSFKFVFTSGARVDESQHQRAENMWLLKEARFSKSKIVTDILDQAKGSNGLIDAFVVYPEYVLQPGSWVPDWMISGTGYFIKGEELALALVRLATEDDSGVHQPHVRNPMLKALGKP